jgi:hypothetical protein
LLVSSRAFADLIRDTFKRGKYQDVILPLTVLCVVSCQRSLEAVFLKWKGMEAAPAGDFFVRSSPGTVKLPPESAKEYIRTRFPPGVVSAS